MSSGPSSPSDGHAPGFRAIRFNIDWITRPLFGILLGLIMLAVVFYGATALAVVLAIAFVPAAFEWHRCVGGVQDKDVGHRNEAILTAVTVAMTEAVFLYSGMFLAGVLVALAGTIAQFVLATRQDKHPGWQAAGVPYLAIPALCLVALCALQHGSLIVMGLFLIVWATDTGALIIGNLIGGPRMAPRLSPGKTWAGTIGGSLLGALVYTFYVSNFLGGSALPALAFGFAFSFFAHAGDLVESLVKRRFGLKNSGALIPGHGGVLDRIDSTLACAPVMAVLVFVAHFNPLFGVHAS
jgi:phosphatidate cytidylyltransferase